MNDRDQHADPGFYIFPIVRHKLIKRETQLEKVGYLCPLILYHGYYWRFHV